MSDSALNVLLKISQLDLSKDPQQLLEAVLATVGREIGAHSCFIMLVNAETGELEMAATFGLPSDYIERVYPKGVPITCSPSGIVLKTGEHSVVRDIFEEPRDERWADLAHELGFSARLCMPLKRRGKIIGLLNVSMAEPHEFTPKEIAFISVAASQIAAMIEGARFYQKLLMQKEELEREIVERKRAEAALHASEENLRALLNATTETAHLVDPTGTILAVNETTANRLGKSADEIIGTCVYDLFPPAVAKSRRACLDEVIRTKCPVHHEDVRQSRIYDLHLYPVFDEAMDVSRIAIYARDITDQKQAEKALRQSEETYRTIFENTGTAMILVEEDMTISCINDETVNLWGYSKEELEGRVKWIELVAEDELPRLLEYHRLRRLDPTAVPKSYELKCLHKRGDVRIALLTGTMIPGTKRSVISLADITEQKRLDEELRRSEALYRAIFETTRSPTVILENDGTFALSNTAGLTLSGYAKEELEGKLKWTDFIATTEDLERMKEIHRLRREDPEKAPRNYEFLFKDRWGNLRNIYVTADIIPGTTQSVVSFCDLTELKQVETALRASEGRFRAFFDTLPVGVLMTDLEGYILAANRALCQLIGYSPEELVGMHFASLYHPEDTAKVHELFTSLKRDERDAYLMESRCVHKDGKLVQGRIHVSGVRDAEGQLTHTTVIAEDITEYKLVKEALLTKKVELEQVIQDIVRVKAALRQSEQKYKEITAFLPDLIYKNILIES
jgi:PAS domain S-box-containing protein